MKCSTFWWMSDLTVGGGGALLRQLLHLTFRLDPWLLAAVPGLLFVPTPWPWTEPEAPGTGSDSRLAIRVTIASKRACSARSRSTGGTIEPPPLRSGSWVLLLLCLEVCEDRFLMKRRVKLVIQKQAMLL